MLQRLLGLATLIAALGAPLAGHAADKILLGRTFGISQLAGNVAQVKGYFKEQNLEVEYKQVPRGAVALEGMSGGSLQFAESAHVPFMAAVSKGIPFVAVGVVTRGFLGKLVAAPKNAHLKTLADFKGKRIGIQVGTGVHTVVRQLLEKQGLKESDFDFANLRVVDMPAAMAAPGNTFDAVFGWEPGVQRIVQSGHGKVVLDANEMERMAGITYPFLLSTTQQYLKDNPGIVQRVVNAYAKGAKFIRDNKDEAVKIYTDEVRKRGGKLTEDQVRAMLFDTERYGGLTFSEGDLKDIPATRDFLIKEGTLKSLPPLDKFLDQSFAKKAEAALTN